MQAGMRAGRERRRDYPGLRSEGLPWAAHWP
jgi:hypothetical protein